MPVEPATPQDLQTGDTWHNWSGNLSATPEKIFHPKDVDDLKQIVALAVQQQKKVRVAADGHSWAAIVPTDGFLVFQSEMNRVTVDKSDPLRPLVTMQAGATVHDVMTKMRAEGVALTSNVVLGSVQYGGLVAPGCHGSGRREQTLSDKVVSMEIVTGKIDPGTGLPEVRTFSPAAGASDELMSAVRLNLGLFGIIHEMTLQAVPAFNVKTLDTKEDMGAVLSSIGPMVQSNDSLDLFWFPFNEKVWVKTVNRTPLPTTHGEHIHNWRVFLNGLDARLGGMAFEVVNANPSLTPAWGRNAFRLIPEREEVESIYDALHYQGAINELRMGNTEIAFAVDPDFANFVQAWSLVVDRLNALADATPPRFPMNMAMNARFIRASDTLIAPSSGNPQGPQDLTCYIEILSHADTPGWPEFEAEIGDAWMNLAGARPHWAKMWENIPNVVPRTIANYGNRLDRFKQIRAAEGVDPQDTFMNPLLEQLFG